MAYANFGIQCFSIAIMLLLLAGIRFDDKRESRGDFFIQAMLIGNCILLLSFMISWLLNGRAELTALIYALTCIKCGFAFVLGFLYTAYIRQVIAEKGGAVPGLVRVIYLLCLTAFLLNVVSVFNHMYFSCENGVYARGPLLFLNQYLAFLVLMLDVILILEGGRALERRLKIILISYAVLPAASAVIQLILPMELDTICIGTTLSLCIIYMWIHVDRGRQIAEKEKELSEYRMSIMLSQIQPHFLYNTLAVIQDMCHGKAPEAEQTIIEFAEFLRGNLDSLSQHKPILFEKELRHTGNYLALERKRFGDLLNVEYDIRADQFRLPALSLQPIVENAVRYGVMQRENGGTVRISSAETEHAYTVTVTDDGVGYDVMVPKQDGRTHIGITNVRNRLETMCGGSLTIKSDPGRGTVAVITIPKD